MMSSDRSVFSMITSRTLVLIGNYEHVRDSLPECKRAELSLSLADRSPRLISLAGLGDIDTTLNAVCIDLE